MKKRIILLVCGVMIFTAIFLYLEQIKRFKIKENNFNTESQSLAIMVKLDGATSYTKSTSIPVGDYNLNSEKTTCENGGVISDYNNSTGKIKMSLVGADKCYLYFDAILDEEPPVISNIVVTENKVTATITDNKALKGYRITSSNSSPSYFYSISGTTYNLSTTVSTNGTNYIWAKDSAGNISSKSFTVSLGTPITTLMSTSTADVYDENGLRYEGADPNNYICLDGNASGACSNSSLLFRIVGLFSEEYSTDGTNSAGTKKLLKLLDTKDYGLFYYANTTNSNDWSLSPAKIAINGDYLTTLLGLINSTNVKNSIIQAKWHLGGLTDFSDMRTYTAADYYSGERNVNTVYSGNPKYLYAKVGLLYPSDYGYATTGGSTISKSSCRTKALYLWEDDDCAKNDWIHSTINVGSSLITPYNYQHYAVLRANGIVYMDNSSAANISANQTFPSLYLNSDNMYVKGGVGSKTNPYHIVVY